jgi:hypothetical protein
VNWRQLIDDYSCDPLCPDQSALARLRLSPLNVVGIGDAENDHAFLRACGCAVAVADALPMVKADAEIVTSAPRGAGVVEMVRRILDGDLAEIAPTIERQTIEIARDPQGEPVRLHPQCGGVLIAGTSGGGKSTAAMGFIEKIIEGGFQLCVIDPEGDYADLEGAIVLGDAKSKPRLPEIAELLGKPDQNVVINLLGRHCRAASLSLGIDAGLVAASRRDGAAALAGD